MCVLFDFVEKWWRLRLLQVHLLEAYHQVVKDLLALLFNLKLKKVFFFKNYFVWLCELIFCDYVHVGVPALGLQL